MNLLGQPPFDDKMAESLVIRALKFAEAQDWNAAVLTMESAAVCASESLLGMIIETLAVFYLRGNQHQKLSRLIPFSNDLTPPIAIGCLLLERNQLKGVGEQYDNKYKLNNLLNKIKQFIADGQYSPSELGIICSLLTQMNHAAIAVPLLEGMIDLFGMETGIDEELVNAVLAVAIAKGLKQDAVRIIQKLEMLSIIWASRATRYRVLLGIQDLATTTPGSDKVLDFLTRSGLHAYSKNRRR